MMELSEEQVKAILEAAMEERRRRAEEMPDEQSAIDSMCRAFVRLLELGWQGAVYCPKDGTVFEVIEAGSTGIHKCVYKGEWPDGGWWIVADDDMWPSYPILWRPIREG